MKLKDIIETLQIVSKYVPEDSRCQAEHDELFLPLSNEHEISAEDDAVLRKLGAFRSSADCWSLFT
jgi:hypothetical protein